MVADDGMILVLTPAQMAAITAAAAAAWPAEACGLLIGHGTRRLVVTREVPAPNLLAEIPGRFELDPRVRLREEKACRGSNDRIIGHWHSHPGGVAEPSATDLAMAFEPDLAWLIVAPPTTCAAAFRPEPDAQRFRRLTLVIAQKKPCTPPSFPT